MEQGNNIYLRLQNARVQLQKLELKKSGKNKYSGFTYFELKDFMPETNEIFLKEKLFSNFSIQGNIANLTIINIDNPEESILFTSPIDKASLKGCVPIQEIGAVHTYMKRYLYLNALEIVEDDVLDPNVGKDESKKRIDFKKEAKPKKASSKVSDFVNKLRNSKLTIEQISSFCNAYNISSKDETTIDEFLNNYDLQNCIDEFLKAS